MNNNFETLYRKYQFGVAISTVTALNVKSSPLQFVLVDVPLRGIMLPLEACAASARGNRHLEQRPVGICDVTEKTVYA
ncbi:MAG TPA: hypothetical protein DET40_00190 [Lentisphaeria bacterium]|nr:MAG: hypothetical protein A2X45_17970 [Lentisphaerae bacterium GWF2_50_93]HCE41951.1 hypothetical protein [Lentisphaeria bacterium]